VIECPLCGTACEKKSEFCENCGWQLVEPAKRRRISRKAVWAAPLVLALAVGLALTWELMRAPQIPQALPFPAPEKAVVGETIAVVAGNTDWPCDAPAEAYQDLAKWILLGDRKNINRALRDIRPSIHLTAGLQGKILDVDFGKRKVRVLGPDAADARTGRECWVTIEALAPGSN
jgi:predicted nucleic acid-binding Zn ribbon protein